MSTGNIRIYGAGGAGINIASQFLDKPEQPGYATPHPCFFDTSRSNMKAGISEKDTYVIEGKDGSGKIRRENASEIAGVIKNALVKFKPMDFNIVVFSASGGSGSVFGPAVVGELLDKGAPTVAVVVGSDESSLTCQNTLNTLKTLEHKAKQAGVPVVMYYDHNNRGGRRTDVDRAMISAIGALSALASGQNDEMDSQDLVNWLQYQKSSTVEPRLAALQIYSSGSDAEAVTNPLSLASLYRQPDASMADIVPDYNTYGYTKADGIEELHFVISVDSIANIGKKVMSTLEELETVRESRVKTESILSNDDDVDENGMVL